MVKKVKVNQGSSFEQTIIGQSPECYITIFIEISPLVPEKKIMEAFLAYMGVGPSWSCDQHHIHKFSFSYNRKFP